MCVQGARWVQQEVLDKYADEDLKTYAVWMPMLASDSRDRWKAALVDDPRMTHYWNGDQAVGKWFTDNVKSCKALGPVAWDAYYLFDADAKWEDAPAPVVACGTPIFKLTEPLVDALNTMFGTSERSRKETQ